MSKTTKIFFTTDIHGSTVCFKKFIGTINSKLSPDVLIIGGDITAKYPVCIVRKGQKWVIEFEGEVTTLNSNEEVQRQMKVLADKGVYGYICEENDAKRLNRKLPEFDKSYEDEVIKKLSCERLREWMNFAQSQLAGKNKKLIINPGNDDPFYIDDVLDEFPTVVIRPEDKIIPLDEYLILVSTGYSNETPWKCPRDFRKEENNPGSTQDEVDLKAKIDNMMHQVPIEKWKYCIFNFHCPPKDTLLDLAPKLDHNLRPIVTGLGQDYSHVGSTAVRSTIEYYRPLISLHGHVHEQSRHQKINTTIIINPGSEYQQGILNGAYLEFTNGQLDRFTLLEDDFETDNWRLVSFDRRILFDVLSHIPFIGGFFKAKIEHESEEKIAEQFENNDKMVQDNEKKLDLINRRINEMDNKLDQIKEIVSKGNSTINSQHTGYAKGESKFPISERPFWFCPGFQLV